MLSLWRLAFGRVESVHDYAGVLVPLDEAHLHSHSARHGRAEFERRHDADDTAPDRCSKDEAREEQGMLMMDAAEYTIEGLRMEMTQGRRGQWTEYESEGPESLQRPLAVRC